ncbi:MAG: zinc ribbon domain-containing protein [Phycisphaerales bacterium]|jgi:putative FmdB family regulatory protein
MPIFEYRCSKCGHVMEVLHKTLNAESPKCEKCGAATNKLLSGFAVGKAAESACDFCPSSPTHGGGCSCGSCGTHGH